jgi:hypothetical protein
MKFREPEDKESALEAALSDDVILNAASHEYGVLKGCLITHTKYFVLVKILVTDLLGDISLHVEEATAILYSWKSSKFIKIHDLPYPRVLGC